jgi:hypothetical protein
VNGKERGRKEKKKGRNRRTSSIGNGIMHAWID